MSTIKTKEEIRCVEVFDDVRVDDSEMEIFTLNYQVCCSPTNTTTDYGAGSESTDNSQARHFDIFTQLLIYSRCRKY